MPISKRRRKPDKKKRRDADQGPALAATSPEAAAESPGGGGGGLLSGMRGGIQNFATGKGKKESLLSKIFTWALVALAAYVLAKRFGLIK